MKITMKTLYATPERCIQIGETADLPTAEAKRLIDEGFAVRAEDDPAEMTADERAKRRKSRSRKAAGSAESGDADDEDAEAGDADHAAFLETQAAGNTQVKR